MKFVWGGLALIGRAFENTGQTRRIRLAAEWLFDSYSSDDALLSFVQTTVVMEILFGDREESNLIGLSTLLANRCVYLVGGTHEERDMILQDFKKIYDVRSRIVHQGRKRFAEEEHDLFVRLRRLCGRAILKELGALKPAE